MGWDAKERAGDEQAAGFYVDRVDGGAGDHRDCQCGDQFEYQARSVAVVAQGCRAGCAVVAGGAGGGSHRWAADCVGGGCQGVSVWAAWG